MRDDNGTCEICDNTLPEACETDCPTRRLERPIDRWRARTDETDTTHKNFQASDLPFYMAFACGFISGVLVCSVIASLIY